MHACEIRAGVTQTLTMRVELLCGRRAVVVFGQLRSNESPVRVIGDGAEGKSMARIVITAAARDFGDVLDGDDSDDNLDGPASISNPSTPVKPPLSTASTPNSMTASTPWAAPREASSCLIS